VSELPADLPAVIARTFGWLYAGDSTPVTRAEVLAVPAAAAAVMKIGGTLAGMPLREHLADNTVTAPRTLFSQPEPHRPYATTMFSTAADVAMFGLGVWRVLARTADGWPTSVAQVPRERVSVATGAPFAGYPTPTTLALDGVPVPWSDVIAFEGPIDGGWCKYGARVLRTAAAIEAAARAYADEPAPTGILRNVTGVELTDGQVTAVLDAWRNARAARATAYLSSNFDYLPQQFDPRAMQLVEARRELAVEIARMTGLPAWSLSAAVEGSSLTYQNLEQNSRDLLAALAPWAATITDRLGMGDVTPRGRTVSFDSHALLAPLEADRYNIYATALGADILSVAEVRTAEGLPPIPVEPSPSGTSSSSSNAGSPGAGASSSSPANTAP
jgi:hypothetical protein